MKEDKLNEAVWEATGKTISGLTGMFLTSVLGAMLMAFPLTFVWNRLAVQFFNFLPEQWAHVSYWYGVGLLYFSGFVFKIIRKLSNAIMGK